MAYRFPLEAVLRVRELTVDTEERTLARINAELVQLRAGLVRAEKELIETGSARLHAMQKIAVSAMHLHASYASEDGLRARARAHREQIEKFEALRVTQMQRCAEAWRAREVLRQFRAKSLSEWRTQQTKRETYAAEEAFLMQYARRLREEQEARADA